MPRKGPSTGRHDDHDEAFRTAPRPAAELERLAEYYDTHDTNTEMDNGEWVELHEITERLNRIERALSAGLPHDDQKTA